jgi:uncharacterized lipoprotein
MMMRRACAAGPLVLLIVLSACKQETNAERLQRLYGQYACHPGAKRRGDAGAIIVRSKQYHHVPVGETDGYTVQNWCKA